MKFKKMFLNIKLDNICGAFGLLVMGVITFANVLSRYVLPVSWAFTEELVTGLFVLITLLGTAIVARNGSFLGLSIFTDMLPKKAKKYVSLLQPISILVFSIYLLIYGIGMVKSELKIGMKTAALEWPEAVFGSFIPIGAAFVILGALQNIVIVLDKKNTYDETEVSK